MSEKELDEKNFPGKEPLCCLFHIGAVATKKYLVQEKATVENVIYGLCFSCIRKRKMDTVNFNFKIDAALGEKLDKLKKKGSDNEDTTNNR